MLGGKLYFLGTGTSQGVPVIGCPCEVCSSLDAKDKRSRSSIHIVYQGVHLQVDTGPDFRSQMIREGIDHIDAVLFTHEHQDHIAGLDDTRPIIFRTGQPMQIFGQDRVLKRVRKVFDYAFEPQPYPGAPKIDAFTIDESKTLVIKGVSIQPLPVVHGKLPILGYRVGNMAYLTDTNHIPSETYLKLKDLEILVIDALHHKNHFSHYTLEQAIEEARKIGAKQTYFIHMSHYMGTHDSIEKELPSGMNLSYDGLIVDFS